MNYKSYTTVLFQRSSVIISDLVLCFACSKAANLVKCSESGVFGRRILNEKHLVLVGCYLGCAGLVIVDHIHFQYNGFLSGFFLLSLVSAAQGDIVLAGFYFSLLLNLKHIYLYVAPVYFVYMLRVHLFRPACFLGVDWRGLVRLGGCVIAVFAASFGPFIEHLPQLFTRLFPVQRGLCHAYWAPNFWALYNAADIAAAKVLSKVGFLQVTGVHPLMSGLVQSADFLVLPNISPVHCATLTLVAMSPVLVKLFQQPSPTLFLKSVTYAALASFFFGYHVHEKAILVILIPYALLTFSDSCAARDYFFLSVVGTYSLFPLLFQVQELLVKVIIHLMLHSFLYPTFRRLHPEFALSGAEKLYLAGLVGHFLVAEVLLPIFLPRMEFLPLVLYSVYCAVGVLYSFFRLGNSTLNS